MRFLLTTIFLLALSFSSLAAKKLEKNGSFGVVLYNNFVKFDYVLSYLGESYKENHWAFRLDFEDNKGFDIASEIVEEKTILEAREINPVQGKVDRKSDTSVVLLFPKEDKTLLKGKVNLYTVILGYKLKKNFRI
jgi:hypothetical protein